jgi:hypothetical protein
MLSALVAIVDGDGNSLPVASDGASIADVGTPIVFRLQSTMGAVSWEILIAGIRLTGNPLGPIAYVVPSALGPDVSFTSTVSDGLSNSQTAIGMIRLQTVLTYSQGGSPTAPIPVSSMSVLPQPDPLNGPKAIWGLRVGGSLANGVFDSGLEIGYNPGFLLQTEPQVVISLENDFRRSLGGVDTTEFHLVMGTSVPNGEVVTRFVTASMSRESGALEVLHQFNSIHADPGITGSWSVADQSSGQTFLQFLGANASAGSDFIAFGPNPASQGTLRLPSFANGGLFCVKAKLGDWDIGAFYNDNIDQLFIGRAFNSAGHSDAPNGATAVQFQLRTQAQGGAYVVANVDNDVDLGLDSLRWRIIRGATVKADALQLTPAIATTATAGTNGALPSQVAGYAFLTVNGTTFKMPLYNV